MNRLWGLLERIQDAISKKGNNGRQTSDEDACPKFSDIPLKSDEELGLAWPPLSRPFEAVSVQTLFRTNAKLIRDLCISSSLSEEEVEAYLLPVITNLAKIVHLTPASEFDHHLGQGGLFTHSLEVAYFSANEARCSLFDVSADPKSIYTNKRRWIFSVILSALAHDIGKPYTDMQIVAEDGSPWSKERMLLDWLRDSHYDPYRCTFRVGRKHNAHKMASLDNLSLLVPPETFQFLGATGYGEVMREEIRKAILLGEEGGMLGKILDHADGQSRQKDLLRPGRIDPQHKNVSHPQGDQLLKGIRLLLSSGVWTCNRDEKSQLFNTTEGCFLVWNDENVRKLVTTIRDSTGVVFPKTLMPLGAIFTDTGIALSNSKDTTPLDDIALLWTLNIPSLSDVPFLCLRLTHPNLVFITIPPVPIEAHIGNLDKKEETEVEAEVKANSETVATDSSMENEVVTPVGNHVLTTVTAVNERASVDDNDGNDDNDDNDDLDDIALPASVLETASYEEDESESESESESEDEEKDEHDVDDEEQINAGVSQEETGADTENDTVPIKTLTDSLPPTPLTLNESVLTERNLLPPTDDAKAAKEEESQPSLSLDTSKPSIESLFDESALFPVERKRKKKHKNKKAPLVPTSETHPDTEEPQPSEQAESRKTEGKDGVNICVPSHGTKKLTTPLVSDIENESESHSALEKTNDSSELPMKERSLFDSYQEKSEDIMEKMLLQLQQGQGDWISELELDPLLQCRSTSSLRFESFLAERGMDISSLQLSLKLQAVQNIRPRWELDTQKHRIYFFDE